MERNIAEIMNAVPIYKENRIAFKRDEKDGYVSVRLNTIPSLQEIFLNSSSIDVLNNCTGTNSVEKIINILSEKYSEVDKDILQEDVVSILESFSQLQIVIWHDKNPFNSNYSIDVDNYKFELLSERNIREIIHFIDNSTKNDISNFVWYRIFSDKFFYNEIYLREMLFKFSEDFFAIRNRESEIVGLISLKYNNSTLSSVGHLGLLICEKSMLQITIKCLVDFPVEKLSRMNICKYKIQIKEDDFTSDKFLIKSLINNGFINEGKSKKEYRGLDLENYCFYIH